MRVLTASEMKAAEAAAVDAGSSYEELMENAGTQAATAVLRLSGGAPSRVLLLCGKGNNAGDAFVLGRLLAQKGWQVEWAALCGESLSPLAQLNRQRMPKEVRRVQPGDINLAVPYIIDGVFGTGFKGVLPAPVKTVFAKANKAAGCRIALDVPSGLNCDTGEGDSDTFYAAHTLTFGALKPALIMPQAEKWYGKVQVLDIGL